MSEQPATQRTYGVSTAWRLYLRETRDLVGPRYYEVEPWAWARLQAKLKQLKKAA